MAGLLDDAKYGVRLQAKSLVFTGVSLLTLAISIGVVTAVFSVINAIILKPLSYPDAQRIIIPWRLAPKDVNLGYDEIPWGIPGFQRIAHDAQSFQSIAAFKGDTFNLTGTGEPVLLDGVRVSSSFFATLATQPLIGRTFTPAEDAPGHGHVVLLGHDLWQQQFLADKEILGRAISLGGERYLVTGVMPPGFAFPRGEEMPGSFGFARRAQLWTPLSAPVAVPPGTPDELAIIARLKPGVSVAQAQAEMQLLRPRMEQDIEGGKGWFNSRVTTLNRQVAGDTRTPLLLTLCAVGVVLLIACSNVANLLLARFLGRSSEFSLRVALGASRSRLVSQLLTESLILAVVGGFLGILLAAEGIHFIKILSPASIPRIHEVSLDFRVFAFAVGITLVSCILFGLVPALGGTRDVAQALRAGGRAAGSTLKSAGTRNALLVGEVALALILMIASGLLAQTFFRLLSVDPGFKAERTISFKLALPASTYSDDAHMVVLYNKALRALRSLPGVEAAGMTEMVPMSGATDGTRIRIPDRVAPSTQDPIVNYTIGSSGYFAALGTPLLRGRPFLDSDTEGSRPVAIINQSMAAKFWPSKDPIGKQVSLAIEGSPLMSIIGVVRDVKHLSLREDPGPELYVPFTQRPFPSMRIMHFVVRGKSDPKLLISGIRSAVRSADPQLPVAEITTLQTILDTNLAGQRFAMLLLSAFAAIALLLAACGLYGVISYSVQQRTREIGVRMALGASRQSVLGMVVKQGMRLTALGTVVGLFVAFALTRLLASFLYGVRPFDTVTFFGVTTLLLAVSTLACYLPARRATRVDPLIALRYE